VAYKDISPAEGATLDIVGGAVAVRAMDGESISGWAGKVGMFEIFGMKNHTKVVIPAGQHELVVTSGNAQEVITHDFEAGHTYKITSTGLGGLGGVKFEDVTK
jgi:hypothetical protein